MSSIDDYRAAIGASISELDELSRPIAAPHSSSEELEGQLSDLGAGGLHHHHQFIENPGSEAHTALASGSLLETLKPPPNPPGRD